jgi:hypothetical protein
MHVLLPAGHPLAEAGKEITRELVFETVVDGGFGRKLTLDQGAILELGRYEKDQSSKLPVVSEEPSTSTQRRQSSSASTNAATANSAADDSSQRHNGDRRRRFSHFHFRKRSANQSVSGPALALVDADHHHAQNDAEDQGKKDGNGNGDEEAGVRVSIRVSALDEDAHPMRSPNEQNTYLHIVRFGSRPSVAMDSAEDTRPWVVRVVKREATVSRFISKSLSNTNDTHIDRSTYIPPARNLWPVVFFLFFGPFSSTGTNRLDVFRNEYLSSSYIPSPSPSPSCTRRRAFI